MKNLKKTIKALFLLLGVILLNSCENENSNDSSTLALEVNNTELATLITYYGLEDTKYIVIEGAQIFSIMDLSVDEFDYIKESFEQANDYIFNLDDKEVFLFKKQDSTNYKLTKSFENPFIDKSIIASKSNYTIEYNISFFEHSDYKGKSVNYSGIQHPTSPPKARNYSRHNVGAAFNDLMSSFIVIFNTNFPFSITGRLYKDHYFQNEMLKFTGTDITGPFYGSTFTEPTVSKNDQMTGWKINLSYVDN